MQKKIIIIGVLLIISLSLLLYRHVFLKPKLISKEEPNLRLETKDSKHDGKIDNWLYRDQKGIPVKWIRDSKHAGRPDKWAFFNNGRSFLDEEDADHDGKVDQIQINLVDSQGYKQRFINLILKDKRVNTFDVQFDTGWITEEEFKKLSR
jgi:hypothetical protein